VADEPAPNLFALNAPGLHVTYSSSSVDGRPRLTYQDTHTTLEFSGDEIRHEETELGVQVTVSTVRTVDTGSTTFSLILPRVRLFNDQPAQIQAIGVRTIHRLAIATPMHGQLDNYQVRTLSGTASFVESLE
jgi:hypothetical protein